MYRLETDGDYEFRYDSQRVSGISVGIFDMPRRNAVYIPVYRRPKDSEPSISLYRSNKVTKDVSMAENTIHHAFIVTLEDGTEYVMDFLPHIVGNYSLYGEKYPFFMGKLEEYSKMYKLRSKMPSIAFLQEFAKAYESGNDFRAEVSMCLSDSIIENISL
jgi:hypothetical protein